MVAERWKRLRPGDPAMVAGAAIYRDQCSACHGSKRSWHSAAASITGKSRARPPCGCTDTYTRWVAAVPAAWPLTRSELHRACRPPAGSYMRTGPARDVTTTATQRVADMKNLTLIAIPCCAVVMGAAPNYPHRRIEPRQSVHPYAPVQSSTPVASPDRPASLIL